MYSQHQSIPKYILLGVLALGMVSTACGDDSQSGTNKPAEQVRFANPGPDDGDLDRDPLGRSIWEKKNWKESRGYERSNARSPSVREEPVRNTSPAGSSPRIAIPVLCYHQNYAGSNSFGGYNVRPARFEEQLKYLKDQGYQSISLTDFQAVMLGNPPANLPEKPVLLTFDDGLTSNESVVLPLMRKYGFRGVLFIYPTIISSQRKNYMRWPQVRRLAASGVFDIGSHTYWHAQLPKLSRAGIRIQLRKSREILERKLGIRVTALAYPFGLYDRRVIEEARAAGYRIAFTINPGSNQPGDPPFTLNRYMVTGLQSMRNFRTYLGLKSPRGISAIPPDGSLVRDGQTFRLRFAQDNPQDLRVYLRGKRIPMRSLGNGTYEGRLRFSTRKNRRYMNMVIRARSSKGTNVYRRMLFLDRNRFKARVANR